MTTAIRHRPGFTLVEILIVVVILGILAAIVIPQFGSASNSARAGSLQTQLQTIRNQIQYYQVQHLGNYPTLSQMTSPDFNNMLVQSNPDSTTTGTPTCGPYFQQAPINAFTGNTAVADGTSVTTGSAANAWLYNSTTGNIIASCPSAQAAQSGLTTNDVATY